ncbi:hypothetical protein BCON_0353g00040 [Botryotinia convoluta]|uniref:Uncharacterized protein n=1 Tax=Botryotinia convoluta TaxID=54673 RepID=A0A4Z1HGK2_9HELO|nr:hypothetical protein BCON_0353g00040 [Botryotinia convoluta]
MPTPFKWRCMAVLSVVTRPAFGHAGQVVVGFTEIIELSLNQIPIRCKQVNRDRVLNCINCGEQYDAATSGTITLN